MMKRKGVLLNVEEEGVHHTCSCMWADNFWIMSHSKEHLEQMLKDLIEGAGKVDVEPKPASLWWTSTYASEEKSDMILGNGKGCYKFPFEDEFKVLGCAMNRQGKTCDAAEERVQPANKAFWKDIMIYKSKDVPLKVKMSASSGPCVCCLFLWNRKLIVDTADIGKIEGWETKTMTRLFRLKRRKDETWVEYHTRTCNMATKIWVQMGLPFLYEKIAESVWRAMEWYVMKR